MRSRLPWLYVNLLTAFLAGGVVYLFQGTVQRTVALGGLDAGHRGDGRQRRHPGARGDGAPARAGPHPEPLFARVVGKEILVGVINGLAIGGVVGVVAALTGRRAAARARRLPRDDRAICSWPASPGFIPIVLERLGIDPAIASSIFVTTFTDVCGFLLLLGLAGWLCSDGARCARSSSSAGCFRSSWRSCGTGGVSSSSAGRGAAMPSATAAAPSA